MTTETKASKRFSLSAIWNSFDREGWLGGLAAFLIAVLLGTLWSVLFWLGVIITIIVFLATRTAHRVSPNSGILAPVDGQLVAIEEAVPPIELKIGTEPMLRLRIASGFGAPNPVWAPQSSTFASLIIEEGDPQSFVALSADKAGLRKAYLGFEATSGELFGVALITGALGPRIDVDIRMGSEHKLGEKIAKRRLGGWCDVYLPTGTELDVLLGQTLVGGETRLSVSRANVDPLREDMPEELEDIVKRDETRTEEEESSDGDSVSETPAEEAPAPEPEASLSKDEDSPDKAAARMFERLKRETKKSKTKD